MKPLAALFALGVIIGAVGGFFVTKAVIKSPIQAVTNPVSTGVTQFILDLINKHDKELKRVNDSTHLVLGTQRKQYEDSLARLHRQESLDSAAFANARTPSDSLHKCTVLALTCQQRADLAERRVQTLTQQLTRQAAQQVHRCGADVGPGVGISVNPLKVNVEPIQAGVHCRIFF